MSRGSQKRYFMGNVNVSQSHISEDYEMKYDESIEQSKNLNNHSMGRSQHSQPKPSQSLYRQEREGDSKAPQLLPSSVIGSIKERYHQLKRLRTDDPDTLYEFFMFYRNSGADTRDKNLAQIQNKIQELRRGVMKPDTQQKIVKLERKLDFQHSLAQDPSDVYYTLMHDKKKIDMNKEVDKHVRKVEEEYRNTRGSSNRRISEEVKKRLYPQETANKLTDQQKEELDKLKFGQKLLDLYEERQEFETIDLSVNNLYDIWLGVPEKEKIGLKAERSDVKSLIRGWMHHNIQNLAKAHFDKKGIKSEDPTVLYNFLLKLNSQSLNYFEVFIPRKGFTVFYEEYVVKQRQINEEKTRQQKRQQSLMAMKEKEITEKVLRRPVSSTPLSVLSMPKNGNVEEILELIKKYPHDKNLKRILAEKATPVIRRPEEYGCHSLEEEIKIKNRVKHEENKNTEKIIENMILNKTVKLEMQQYSSTLMKLLNEEKLAEGEKWTKTRELLQEAMRAELYSEPELSSSLHEFAEAHLKELQTPSKTDNKTLINEIIKHLDSHSKNRQNKLGHLKSLIQKVKEEKEQKEAGGEKNQNQPQREKRKFYNFLTEWARVYIESFIQNKLPNESRRDFMNQFYAKTVELHKPYVTKHFPVFEQTEGLKSIHSPLLKYEFFKMVKDINPETMLVDERAKNAAWTPAGRSDGFSTFNRLSSAYFHQPKLPASTVKNMVSDRKDGTKEKQTPNVWEKKKFDQRSKFMMKMSDAAECTFKPNAHKV